MKKILLISLLIFTLILTGCSSSPKTLSPKVIREWSGRDTKTTESFNISANQWAVSWVFQPSSPTFGISANYFSIIVYESGNPIPVSMVANIANADSNRSDISYIHQSGNFYLMITAFEGRWAINVYDYK